MDHKTATATVNHINALLACPGWDKWFLPLLEKIQAELKTANIDAKTTPEDKAANCSIHAFLDELRRKPEQHLQAAHAILRTKDKDKD